MTDPNMHKDFATWYSHVLLEDDPARLAARWEGVNSLVKKADSEDCEHILDIFLVRPGAMNSTAGDLMREAFTDQDAQFPHSGNEAEMALLAEIILALKLESQEHDEFAGYVACLVYSALHGGNLEINSKTDLFSRAEHALRFQGIEARKHKKLTDAPTTLTPTIKIDDCFEGISDWTNVEEAKEILRKIVFKTAKAMGDLARRASEERRQLERELHIQGEELDLLWWASNGRSEIIREQFSSMTESGKPLIAGCEAANLTQLFPGPASIAGLLEKAGLNARDKISLSTVVNGCNVDWLRQIQQDNVTLATPIHYAIRERLLSPNSDAWSGHWTAVTGIDASKERSIVNVAELFYHERLVLNAFGSSK